MTKMYKMLFSSSMVLGTLISISSYSWMGMWLGLEINLLSIIPLMADKKNVLSTESSLKYFITQAMASTILLFSVMLMMMMHNTLNNMEYSMFPMIILNSSLLTKMGAAPFHFWFPEVMEGLNWMNCLILLTWQKIAPMVLVMYNIKMLYFMSMIIIFSMIVSGVIGINQTSLRKILAYSSINHIAWMISSMFFMESVWLNYFCVYTIISINMVLIFQMFNIFYLKQLFMSLNNNMMMKILFIMNFLSLGGLPPFLGFFPKWMTIQVLVLNGMYLLSFIMVILTLITLYFYMRITFSTLLLSMNEPNWSMNWNFSETNYNFTMVFNMLSILGLVFCTILFNWL